MNSPAALQRQYIPKSIDFSDWSALEPLYKSLLDKPIASARELEGFLSHFSELCAATYEYSSRCYIDKSCHTDDEAIEKRFMHFVENVDPKIKPYFFELQKKFLDSPYRSSLTDKRFVMLIRSWAADVELFRTENIPLETEITKLVTDYDKICGAMMVDFNGKQLTMPQLGKFQEETDRALRQAAFEAGAKRRLVDRDKLEKIFDDIRPIRQKLAKNAGYDDFRSFAWKDKKRFDYTPDDCIAFADAIEKSVVPLVRELDRKRMSQMGLTSLRPWDTLVDPKGRSPLRPFKEDDINEFVNCTKKIFDRMSPELANDFETLRTNGNLDLDSRKGKQPGGYQCNLDESKQPFIFMNSAGTQRDVEVLLHEGGHAFHSMAAVHEPLTFLRHAPMEFCEVASMSMEALGSEHYDVIYSDPESALRAKQTYFEGVIRFFPWMATIDMFQHWIYTHPDHTPAERTNYWLSLLSRFGGLVDYTGYEEIKACSWQRQLHLYHYPFYYIEYGIAQLGALQIWMKAKEDPQRALTNYRRALALGGTRPLPDLFTAAGIQFDFSVKTLEPLMKAVGEELI